MRGQTLLPHPHPPLFHLAGATATAGMSILGHDANETLSGAAGNDTINSSGVWQSERRRNQAWTTCAARRWRRIPFRVGAGFDDINGNKGNDTIDGGSGGSDWLVGGPEATTASPPHIGQNLVYGNLGNDTLHGGAGGDVLRGGQGDDVIVGGSGNDFVSGDRGNDTMTGGGGADTFHSSQDAGIDRVLDFHVLEGDRVELDLGTHYTVSQVGADTVIDMGGGNEMVLVGVSMSSLTSNSIFF